MVLVTLLLYEFGDREVTSEFASGEFSQGGRKLPNA